MQLLQCFFDQDQMNGGLAGRVIENRPFPRACGPGGPVGFDRSSFAFYFNGLGSRGRYVCGSSHLAGDWGGGGIASGKKQSDCQQGNHGDTCQTVRDNGFEAPLFGGFLGIGPDPGRCI